MCAFVDIEKVILDKEGKQQPVLADRIKEIADSDSGSLDWKRSMTDFLRAIKLDPSYGSRKELALELGYQMEDIIRKGASEMNTWLLAEVFQRLEKRGLKLPDDVKKK